MSPSSFTRMLFSRNFPKYIYCGGRQISLKEWPLQKKGEKLINLNISNDDEYLFLYGSSSLQLENDSDFCWFFENWVAWRLLRYKWEMYKSDFDVNVTFVKHSDNKMNMITSRIFFEIQQTNKDVREKGCSSHSNRSQAHHDPTHKPLSSKV